MATLVACAPADPLDPLLDVTPAPLNDGQRAALPDAFVGLVLAPGSARAVGVGLELESRQVELSAEPDALTDMVWQGLLRGLPTETPLVVVLDRGLHPDWLDHTLVTTGEAGFAPPLLVGVGSALAPSPVPRSLRSAYMSPDDPVLFPTWPDALSTAPMPVLVSPLATRADDEALFDALVDAVSARPERQKWVEDVLGAVLRRRPDSPAVAWLATAITLGGTPLDHLEIDAAAAETASIDAARQRQNSRPVGSWASAKLGPSYRRDAWLRQPLPEPVRVDIRIALIEEPGLMGRLRAERTLDAILFGDGGSPDPTQSGSTSLLTRPRDPGGLEARRWDADDIPPFSLRRVPNRQTEDTPSVRMRAAPGYHRARADLFDALADDLRNAGLTHHVEDLRTRATLHRSWEGGTGPVALPAGPARQALPLAWDRRGRPRTRLTVGVAQVPIRVDGHDATLLTLIESEVVPETLPDVTRLPDRIRESAARDRLLASEPHAGRGCATATP